MEEHIAKMFGELIATDSDSESVFSPGTEPNHVNFHWNSAVWELESIEDRFSSASGEKMRLEDICPPVNQPPAIVARAGGHVKDNPVYSSGSDCSDIAYITTKSLLFAANSIPFEESFSSSDRGQRPSSLQSASSVKDMLQKSIDDFINNVQSQICKMLKKIQDDQSPVSSVPEEELVVTPRTRSIIDETRQQLVSILNDL